MSCISTVSISILFNGEALETIYPSRGIRQGDHLSPYMFILCMEYLGQLIVEKCNAKLWQPIKASGSRPTFSHLFFADDLVLFARADGTNCSTIRDVLDEFCSISGQTISEAKSRAYFSPNVDRDTRESLSDILGFSSTPFDLVSTLGYLLCIQDPPPLSTILFWIGLNKNLQDGRRICFPLLVVLFLFKPLLR